MTEKITIELHTIAPAATHTATAAAILATLAKVFARPQLPEELMIVLDTTEDGTRFGLLVSRYSPTTYSIFPAFMGPDRHRPDHLGSIYKPLGCLIAADTDPEAADTASALALACRRLKRLRAAR